MLVRPDVGQDCEKACAWKIRASTNNRDARRGLRVDIAFNGLDQGYLQISSICSTFTITNSIPKTYLIVFQGFIRVFSHWNSLCTGNLFQKGEAPAWADGRESIQPREVYIQKNKHTITVCIVYS